MRPPSGCFAASLFALVVAAARPLHGAQEPVSLEPLVRLNSKGTLVLSVGPHYFSDDVFVTKGGRVFVTHEVRFGAGGQVKITEATATRDQQQSLQQALGDEQIGHLQGDCAVAVGGKAGSFGQWDLTWYGRKGRTNRLLVGPSFQADCSAAVSRILTAVSNFVFQVSSNPGAKITTDTY